MNWRFQIIHNSSWNIAVLITSISLKDNQLPAELFHYRQPAHQVQWESQKRFFLYPPCKKQLEKV